MANRKTSQNGVNLIMSCEGCRLTAYYCSAGVLTIGYGHTGSDVKQGMTISQAQAEALLKKDLQKFEGFVNNKVYVPVTESLNQNQFDSLVSFAFNCGQGSLKTLCKDRTIDQIAASIPKYCKAGGKTLAGLVTRRAKEQALFLTAADGTNQIVTSYKTNCKAIASNSCLLFQKAVNADKIASLVEDGKFGPKTKAVMNQISLSANFNKVTGCYVVGSKGELVRFVQMKVGVPEDGLYGAGTRNAVRGYQEKNGLKADGVAGPATLSKMI